MDIEQINLLKRLIKKELLEIELNKNLFDKTLWIFYYNELVNLDKILKDYYEE